jgi:hypothetical protein
MEAMRGLLDVDLWLPGKSLAGHLRKGDGGKCDENDNRGDRLEKEPARFFLVLCSHCLIDPRSPEQSYRTAGQRKVGDRRCVSFPFAPPRCCQRVTRITDTPRFRT